MTILDIRKSRASPKRFLLNKNNQSVFSNTDAYVSGVFQAHIVAVALTGLFHIF